MKVCFVVKSLDISGGIYVVLQHAEFMSSKGVDVAIAQVSAFDGSVIAWHPALRKLKLVSIEEVASETFDLAIATWWSTAYDLYKVDARKYVYFVQLEDYLAQPAHLRDLAEDTYHLGLDAIAVSAHLGDELIHHYGMRAHVALNGIDKNVFSTIGPAASPRQEGRLRVLIEGPLGSSCKNVAFAIGLARRAQPDEIWLLTSSKISWYPGVERVFSRLNAEECASVYRSCDVLLKLSTLESCCLPNLEMFHCGGTVVAYDIFGPNEYLVDGHNAMVRPIGDEEGVVKALQALKQNPLLLETLQAGARSTAEGWLTWQNSSATFHRLCLELLEQPGTSREDLRQKSMAKIIPSRKRSPLAAGLQRAKSIVDKSSRLKEIKTVLRAFLLEEHQTPRPVMPDRCETGASLMNPVRVS